MDLILYTKRLRGALRELLEVAFPPVGIGADDYILEAHNRAKRNALAILEDAQMTTEFRWLIEAPGGKYLAARHVGMADDFVWTTDHDQAIALRSEDQACRFLWSFRQMDRDLNKGALFAFENTLGPARAIEHGWIAKD